MLLILVTIFYDIIYYKELQEEVLEAARMNIFYTVHIVHYIIFIRLATVSRTKLWRMEKRREEEAAAVAAGLPPPKKRKAHKEHVCTTCSQAKNSKYRNIITM